MHARCSDKKCSKTYKTNDKSKSKDMYSMEITLNYCMCTINPFTLRAPQKPNVCYFHTFENNLRTKRRFTKYLKESCILASDKHFSFMCFQENTFRSNIFTNVSGLFWLV